MLTLIVKWGDKVDHLSWSAGKVDRKKGGDHSKLPSKVNLGRGGGSTARDRTEHGRAGCPGGPESGFKVKAPCAEPSRKAAFLWILYLLSHII